jgi:hypothetical protein
VFDPMPPFPPAPTIPRSLLPLVAFAGHAPGLWLARHRLTPVTKRQNVIALGATLVAMAASWVLASEASRGRWVLVVWLVGHFAWSTWLALGVHRGVAVEPRG